MCQSRDRRRTSVRRIGSMAMILALVGWAFAPGDDAKPKLDAAASAKSASTETGSAKAEATGRNSNKPKAAITITPEREAAAIAFVQRNHAELAELLGYLKSSQPEEYTRAIREIYRTTERLAQIVERDPALYDLEVSAWTAQSHVQLLAAKLKMG